MAYANPYKIANGLTLDFILDSANTSLDNFLGYNSTGQITSFTSIPASRIGSGGNLTEATSAVLTITGGTGAVLSGVTIQVKAASTSQAGYLSATDWNTFNNKISPTLSSAKILVGNGSNVATAVDMTGDIAITNAGVTSIGANKIVNAQINSTAAIAQSKMAALTASLVMATDGSGFATTVAGFTTTIAGFLTTVSSNVQSQINGKLSVTLTAPISGDVITYNGANWVNSPSGSGVPAGGTADQYLNKIDGTNYNTQWSTLTLAKITDVTATFSEVNKLSGVTTTTAQFNYLNTLTSNVQTQIGLKLTNSLAQNAIFLGNVSNQAGVLAAGTEGYALVISGGVPTWSAVVGTGTVTSIDVNGGTTGLTFSGGPVTTTGTITMAGVLGPANGGSGGTAGAWLVDSGAVLTAGQDIDNAGFNLGFVGGGNITFDLSGTGGLSIQNTASASIDSIGNITIGANATQVYLGNGGIPVVLDGNVLYSPGAIGVGKALAYFQSGSLLTTPATGAWEFNGTHLYFGIAATRYQIDRPVLNSISAAAATNTIDNTNFQQDWLWDTLAGGTGLSLSSASTAATTNSQTLFKASLTGNNASASQTTYAASISNQHGGSGTNVALYLTATSGTNNYALIVNSGKVGINTTTPTALLHLAAGTATANTAPLKLTTGTALSSVEDGAFEYHTSHLYFSIASTRYQLDQQLAGITSDGSGQFYGDQSKTRWYERPLAEHTGITSSVSTVMQSTEIADGEAVTIEILWTAKDDNTNTGAGGRYIATWTKAAGTLSRVFQSDTDKGNNIGSTINITTQDTAGSIEAKCDDPGGVFGNFSISWIAKIIHRKP